MSSIKRSLTFLAKVTGLFGQTQTHSQVQPTTAVIPQPQPTPPATKQTRVLIPQNHQTKLTTPTSKPRIVIEETTPVSQQTAVAQTLTPEKIISSHRIQFSQDAAPPSPPIKPNTISGQVMDSAGKIIEGAILEIRDEAGRPVRAIRTNKAGHFLTVTPVLNGVYQLTAEKEGYEFGPVTFEARGDFILPIAVHAKAAKKPQTHQS